MAFQPNGTAALGVAGAFPILLAGGLSATAPGNGPVDIGSQRELFVDGRLIERLTNARQVLHHPVPREVAIVHDKPWEGNTSGYHTVFKDGDRYRLYYRGSHVAGGRFNEIKDHPQFTCYAESRDGVSWTRPDLGLVEFNGSKHNNIILAGAGTHNFAPFRDLKPDCPEDARYKALASGKGGLLAFKSPDGIHWTLLADKPVITKGAFDSQNLAFWDVARDRYVDFHRGFHNGVRDIMTCTSKDFVNWTDPVWLEYGDAPAEQLYTNQIVAYHRAPHLFLGFPKRFMPDRRLAGNRMPGLSDGVFMSSRDGRRFHRWLEAFIRPGLNRERWFNRNNMTAWGLVETATDIPGCPTELSLYSTEAYYETPACRLRRFTLRLDGFVSIQAPTLGGELITRPLIFRPDANSAPRPRPPTPLPAAKSPQAPLIGSRSLRVREPTVFSIPGTRDLGKAVTLAVHVRGIPAGFRRIFSAYNGGPIEPGGGELVFDIFLGGAHPDGSAVRFKYSGVYVFVPADKLGAWGRGEDADTVHHLAATWDDGAVVIYLDGKEMARGGKPGAGPLRFRLGDLRFGEDYPPTSLANEPFLGDADDILVLRRVLTAEEIARLAREGAEAVVDPAVDEGALYTMESDEPDVLRNRLPKGGAGDVRIGRPGAPWADVMLLVNFSTSAAGSLRCEIQDAAGKPLPGFSLEECDLIYGDSIERAVSWRGRAELKQLAGQPIKLRFELKDADLYAIRFGQPEPTR
ncbi:MAG: hypothetical protein GXP31_14440 [Kiritimatiellaeota bacterium]|nr:hypothetical protein [Kiritimatiellota bacterium]